MPLSIKAVIVVEGQKVEVKDVPVPELGQGEVLVKVKGIAQNPTDWKHVAYLSKPGNCDLAGVVEKVGPDPQKGDVKVGDRVMAFVHGGNYVDWGAFAEYAKVDSDLLLKVPENLDFPEAASMGCSSWTAAQGLFHRIGLVEPPAKVEKPEWVLVYGGTTSVGQYAIQLAKAAGYRVVTTASPHNHELYRSPTVSEDIRKVTDDSIRSGMDTISEGASQPISVKAFGKNGGKLCVILAQSEEAASQRPDVQIIFTLLYTSLGKEFTFGGKQHFPASPSDREYQASFLKKVPALLGQGLVRPNRTRLVEDGLDGVWEGMRLLREGKISAQKVVHRLE